MFLVFAKSIREFLDNPTSEMPADELDDLPSPFGPLGLHLSQSELRETAYKILIAACRSSGASRPLTYVSSSVRTTERSRSMSPNLQRSVTSAAASKVKKALGLKSRKKVPDLDQEEAPAGRNPAAQKKRSSTVGELMRDQMKVLEQTDPRVRSRALLRVAAGQVKSLTIKIMRENLAISVNSNRLSNMYYKS